MLSKVYIILKMKKMCILRQSLVTCCTMTCVKPGTAEIFVYIHTTSPPVYHGTAFPFSCLISLFNSILYSEYRQISLET